MAHHVKAKHINTFTDIWHLYRIRYQVLCIGNAKELPYLKTKGEKAMQIVGQEITLKSTPSYHRYLYKKMHTKWHTM